MKLKVLVITSLFLCAATIQAGETDRPKPLLPEAIAPEFKLNDFRGAEWKWGDVQDKSIVVIAFLGTECPLVRLYAERLQQIADTYQPRNVAFIGINSNQQDSLAEIGQFVKATDIKFPVLKDAGNVVADQFGAQRTPEVFVLDSNRRVLYHGRIDDQYTYGVQKQKAEKNFLVDAIDAALAKQPVSMPNTEVVGCQIGRVLTPKSDSQVTYSKQISRILNQRCVQCHRSGEIGPFALTNYAETVGWAEMIAEVVREERMPPWHANPKHGQFANDARLKPEERQLIEQWVEAGAPEGDSSDLPTPPQFGEGWRIGKPDMVIQMADKPYSVPATGEVRYQYFVVDPGFKEDKWIQAAECRPGNRAVVHHIIVAAGNRERTAERLNDEVVSDWLAATAPGARPMILPQGLAKRIPAGSKIIFQLHYTPNGKAQDDLSSVGLIFADPNTVKHEVLTQKAANPRFKIPPGDSNHKVEADYRFAEDSLMLAMFPHMHLRGKSFTYTAHYPDGREEVLLDVPRYDFSWQNSYEYAEGKLMPAGTRIHCVAHFDNSKENWANPDPTATVRWGDQTWEEMMIGYFDITTVRPVTLKPRPDDRVETFLKKFGDGPVAVPDETKTSASKALESSESWQKFAKNVKEIVPQLDRVCWVSVKDGRLTVERVAQEVGGRRNGEGTVAPAEQLLLAKYASGSEVVSHPDISTLTAPDFRLLSRLFSSSVHIPVKIQDKPGVISFWSTDRDAFPVVAQHALKEIAHAVAAPASESR